MSWTELTDAEVGRHHWRSPAQPLPKAGMPRTGCAMLGPVGLWVTPRDPKRATPSITCHPHSKNIFKNIYFLFRLFISFFSILFSSKVNFLVFLHVLIAMSPGTSWEEPGCVFFTPHVHALWKAHAHFWFPNIDWLLWVCGCFVLLVFFHLELWGISVLPGAVEALVFLVCSCVSLKEGNPQQIVHTLPS